jgi:hypothetical protein
MNKSSPAAAREQRRVRLYAAGILCSITSYRNQLAYVAQSEHPNKKSIIGSSASLLTWPD